MYSYIIASRDEMEEDPAGLMVAESRGPKEDHKKSGVALFCYFMLGAGVLGPWNAFITAVDYFAHVFGEAGHYPASLTGLGIRPPFARLGN
eukprot:gene13700-19593_t